MVPYRVKIWAQMLLGFCIGSGKHGLVVWLLLLVNIWILRDAADDATRRVTRRCRQSQDADLSIIVHSQVFRNMLPYDYSKLAEAEGRVRRVRV